MEEKEGRRVEKKGKKEKRRGGGGGGYRVRGGVCVVDIPDSEPGKRKGSSLLYALENILFK